MDDYYSDSQPALIHCKFCGEDYAATYKYCPSATQRLTAKDGAQRPQ